MYGAIVTLVVGEAYRASWEKHCRPNWEAYARKFDLELVIITQLPDQSALGLERPVTWQKLLIGRAPQLQRHKRVLWLDADVIVNSDTAPNIFEGIPSGKVGAVRHSVFFENPLFAEAFHRVVGNFPSVEDFRRAMFVKAGMEPVRPYLDAGVLAFCDFDLRLLEQIYDHYREVTISYGDQIPLSYELARAGFIWEVDPRFNVTWYALKHSVYDFSKTFLPEMQRLYIAQALSFSYFLHFAGNQQDMEYFDDRISLKPRQANVTVDSLEKIARQLLRALPEDVRESILASFKAK
jgi:hypothetical protein